ncbi:MAG: low specificity L-threonine aldolase [Bacteroidales bacterium]|nr:low specificity L-threonine aldolase [Bacteroidales bacterium]
MKYSFLNDYSEGGHQNILDALLSSNLEQLEGYGEDKYSLSAAEKIKKKLNCPNADIHFVTGGTQANLLCISSFLKPYESVIAAQTAHIEVHEAGAIEFTGHKINTYLGENGKISPEEIQYAVDFHYDEHMVVPRLVFISNSTELGTVYTKNELENISKICKKNNLYLYIDGARLGAAMTSKNNDLKFEDLCKYADAFYIGGTKNGALIGEAIVIINPELKSYFRYNMKQKGALPAKGRLLGIQFDVLFSDNLFFDLANHANKMAQKLANGLKAKGYPFFAEPITNQIFPILPNEIIQKLSKHFEFYVWSKFDENNSVLRLVCSWATKEEAVDAFLNFEALTKH